MKPPPDRCLCDFSFAKPRPEQVKVAGVVTYLSNDAGKVMSPAQTRSFLDAGLTVSFVKQDGKTDALGGRAVGVRKALEANAQADQRGVPEWVPIIFIAQDSGLSSSDHPEVARFFEGVRSVPGRPVGRYGGGNVFRFLDGVFGPNAFAVNWLAAATSWGAYAGAHLRQMPGAPWYPIAGVPTDDDEILKPFARWGMPAPSQLSDADRTLLADAGLNLTATARLLG